MSAAKPPFPVLRRGQPLAQGLVLGLPLHEGSGLTAHDLSGRGSDGTLTNGPAWVAGPAGWCLSFDGSDDSVVLPAAAAPPSGDGAEMTIAFWMYYSNASQNAILVQQEPVNTRWLVFLEGGSLKVRGGTATSLVSVTAPSANTWHHVVAAYKNAIISVSFMDVRLYMDGALAGSNTTSTTADNFVKGSSQVDVGRGNDFAAYAYSGLLDGLSIHARQLSSLEAAALYADSWQMYRRPGWRLKVAAAGGAFQPAWASGSNQWIGPGVLTC